MGAFNFSIPTTIVKKIANKVKIDNFVETGTYMGGTAFWAASIFPRVYTVEINEEISRKAQNTPGRPANVEFFIGNSRTELSKIVNKLNGRSFFWLDGHWCAGDVLEKECPLLEEIRAVNRCKDAIIFIDDARCFMGPIPDWPEQLPRIDQIFHTIKENFPNHFTTIHNDVIISVPSDVIGVLDEDWKNNFWKRFSSVTIGRKRCIGWFLNIRKANKKYLVLNREENE